MFHHLTFEGRSTPNSVVPTSTACFTREINISKSINHVSRIASAKLGQHDRHAEMVHPHFRLYNAQEIMFLKSPKGNHDPGKNEN